MKRRLLGAVLASVVLASPQPAYAQEIQLTGPLKGAPAVRNMRMYREGRLEIAPAASFTLLDEYRRTILFGARLTYHLKDWLGIGVWGAFGAVSMTTTLTNEINQTAPRDDLTAINVNHTGDPTTSPPQPLGPAPFAAQTAQLNYVLAPQVTFIPFRGKLAIFNKIFVDTDFYASGGVGFVGIKERANCTTVALQQSGGPAGEPGCAQPASFVLQSESRIAPTFGVGFTFYLGGTVSLGVEYRALPFAWNRAGFDTRGAGPGNNFPDGQVNGTDDTFRFNQLVTVSLGFSLPAKPKISQ
jgi:outer membrane beta-barrel protein